MKSIDPKNKSPISLPTSSSKPAVAERPPPKATPSSWTPAALTSPKVNDGFVTSAVKLVTGFFSSEDAKYDGHLVGRGGIAYPAGTPLGQVPGVQPKGGPRNDKTILYVNGIQSTKEKQFESLQRIAESTGSTVVGVHNATENILSDSIQTWSDKMKGANPAVDSLADTVYRELRANRPVHLIAHSQGGVITARALEDVKARLQIEDGLSNNQAEMLLARVECETMGAAATSYVDGPKYTHFVNLADSIPMVMGQGNFWNPVTYGGRGAKTVEFTNIKLIPFDNHTFDTYFDQREFIEGTR